MPELRPSVVQQHHLAGLELEVPIPSSGSAAGVPWERLFGRSAHTRPGRERPLTRSNGGIVGALVTDPSRFELARM